LVPWIWTANAFMGAIVSCQQTVTSLRIGRHSAAIRFVTSGSAKTMRTRSPLLVVFLFFCCLASTTHLLAQSHAELQVLATGWKIEQVLSAPELVTPVGCVFDSSGALLVIESHTHFPADGYPGPASDRIYRIDDSDGDGVVDRQRLFYEGGTASMGLTALPDDWIAIASRSQVIAIRDGDRDGVAEQRRRLLKLETDASYPHNGLGGITLGKNGNLYVGQGENLGESYTLIAADGSRQTGGGEGGNVFCVGTDGSHLKRIATGFWNPFGLHFDSAGRLWTVGNDPDAMPPCRLLHVIEGGDYGFQFRFGRAGTHPLQSWNGELPGTLPMAAGTGEAPCAVAEHDGHLWVTSWGSNRIERYRLTPAGASLKATMETVVQGGPMFRPVGIAVARDGSIYITDWVDRSYSVHGKGRLWRLSRAPSIEDEHDRVQIPPLSPPEARAQQLLSDHALPAQARMAALNDDDPFLRHSAAIGLVSSGQLEDIARDSASTARQRVGLLSGWRWRELCHPDAVTERQRTEWVRWGLADRSPQVAVAAIRWATERNCVDQSAAIKGLLRRDHLTPTLFAAAIASIAYLDTGTVQSGLQDPACVELLNEVASDAQQSPQIRSLAIAMFPASSDRPTAEQLSQWVAEEKDRRFGGQIVRLLVDRSRGDDDRGRRAEQRAIEQIAIIATDRSNHPQVRADAIAGLSQHAGKYSRILNLAALPSQPEIIRSEATRVLKRVRSQGSTEYPSPNDHAAWEQWVGAGGDPQSGRRVFYRTTCANCHAHSGRGSSVGPDLTNLSGHMTRGRLIDSILLPSQEVAPLFVTWKVLTVDGRVLTGMKLDKGGSGGSSRFLGAEGGVFEVPLEDTQTQSPVAASIMPAGLEQTMSMDEFRDLIAFLENPSW
jgi:putative membrane-bound dehydrogenase-like protein